VSLTRHGQRKTAPRSVRADRGDGRASADDRAGRELHRLALHAVESGTPSTWSAFQNGDIEGRFHGRQAWHSDRSSTSAGAVGDGCKWARPESASPGFRRQGDVLLRDRETILSCGPGAKAPS